VATSSADPQSQPTSSWITDDEVLEAMLSAPLEQWRVFSAPSQRKVGDRHWNGSGEGAGARSGKCGQTVCGHGASHRRGWHPAWRCRLMPVGAWPGACFTTFTRNLATGSLGTDIRRQPSQDPRSTEALQRNRGGFIFEWAGVMKSVLKIPGRPSLGFSCDVFLYDQRSADLVLEPWHHGCPATRTT